ncbi:MAG: inorganic phosphate transporter [Anaerolineales bacterium]
MFPVVLALALGFNFLNGFLDSSSLVATVISSRSLHPRAALALAALAELAGPFLFGVAVATTVGTGFLRTDSLTLAVLASGLAAAVLWSLVTLLFALPSSSSHALFGGLIGSAVLASGVQAVLLSGLGVILIALIAAPILGFGVGFIVMRLTLWAVRNATPRVSGVFRRLQIFTLIGLALSHGANDAQKSMGVIALALVLASRQARFEIPLWVVAASAGTIAIGTSIGGWRLIRTLGGRIYRIRPIHGFASQAAGAAVVLGAALMGGPVSTTQVLSSSITGVGAADRRGKVRWTVLRQMATAWILTMPATALLSAGIYALLGQVGVR